jgi:hypothetical protein
MAWTRAGGHAVKSSPPASTKARLAGWLLHETGTKSAGRDNLVREHVGCAQHNARHERLAAGRWEGKDRRGV